MKQHQIRRIHRIVAPTLFIFILIQTVSGLVMSVGQLQERHAHAGDSHQSMTGMASHEDIRNPVKNKISEGHDDYEGNFINNKMRRRIGWLTTFSDSLVVNPTPVKAERA